MASLDFELRIREPKSLSLQLTYVEYFIWDERDQFAQMAVIGPLISPITTWKQTFEGLFNDVSVMDLRIKADLVQIDTFVNPILACDLQCGSDK